MRVSFLWTLPVAGLLLVAMVPGQGGACGPVFPLVGRPVYFPSAPYVPPVVEVPVPVPVPLYVPTFLVGATPPQPVPVAATSATGPAPPPVQPSACEERLAALTARLAALEARLGGGAGAERSGVPPAGTRFPVLTRSCLPCHGATPYREGDKQADTFLDAKGAISLTPDRAAVAIRKAYNGSMPLKGNAKGIKPLSDDDLAAVVQELSDFGKKEGGQ